MIKATCKGHYSYLRTMQAYHFIYPMILVLLMASRPVNGQIISKREELRQQLQGMTTLDEVMQVIEAFYQDLPDKGVYPANGLPKYKFIKRLEWYLSGRLGKHGELVNIDSLNRAARQEQYRNTGGNISGSLRAPTNWFEIGPATSPGSSSGIGRVDRLAFHPVDSNTLYAGTPAGGLWKTTDGGATWVPKSDFLPSLAILGIVVSHANPEVIYILTGDGDSHMGGFIYQFGYVRQSAGVFKSTDGGDSWTQLELPITDDYYGYRLVQHWNDANILYAATSEGLYRTLDGGTNWALMVPGNVYDVEFHPSDQNIIYASATNKIWRTVTAGFTWGECFTDPQLCSGGRIELAVSLAEPDIVYALSGPADTGAFCGLFKSTNMGALFNLQASTPNILGQQTNGADANDQSGYDLAIAVDPADENTLYTGGLIIWKSTNGGSGLTATSGYWETCPTNCPVFCCLNPSQYVHPDIHDLAINPLNNTLYAAGDGGIWKTTDGGSNWTLISNGIGATQFYHIAGRSGFYNDIYGGAQDNGVKYRDDMSTEFDHITGGDGFALWGAASATQRFYSSVNSVMYRFTKTGNSFDRQTITPDTAGGNQMFFKTVVAHPALDSIVLAGAKDIWKSTDLGDTWTNKGASGSWAMATCPSNPSRFYSAGGDNYSNGSGALFRSDNNGNNWNVVSNNPGFPSSGSWVRISDIAVSPLFSGTVCASFSGYSAGIKVVLSTNAGTTWTNISYNLPNIPVNCIAMDDNHNIYAGTDIGVYFIPQAATSWEFTSSGLPNVPVTDFIVYPQISSMYASTFGRGVWASALSPCPVNLTVSETIANIRIYEAGTSVVSTNNITATGTVLMKSGGPIKWLPGFKANAGCLLKTQLGNCTTLFDPVD